jgi:hypothetical protein
MDPMASFYENGNDLSGFVKRRGISWFAVRLLASQALCSIERFSWCIRWDHETAKQLLIVHMRKSVDYVVMSRTFTKGILLWVRNEKMKKKLKLHMCLVTVDTEHVIVKQREQIFWHNNLPSSLRTCAVYGSTSSWSQEEIIFVFKKRRWSSPQCISNARISSVQYVTRSPVSENHFGMHVFHYHCNILDKKYKKWDYKWKVPRVPSFFLNYLFRPKLYMAINTRNFCFLGGGALSIVRWGHVVA